MAWSCSSLPCSFWFSQRETRRSSAGKGLFSAYVIFFIWCIFSGGCEKYVFAGECCSAKMFGLKCYPPKMLERKLSADDNSSRSIVPIWFSPDRTAGSTLFLEPSLIFRIVPMKRLCRKSPPCPLPWRKQVVFL